MMDLTSGGNENSNPFKVDYQETRIDHYGNKNSIVMNGPMSYVYDRKSEQTNINEYNSRKHRLLNKQQKCIKMRDTEYKVM